MDASKAFTLIESIVSFVMKDGESYTAFFDQCIPGKSCGVDGIVVGGIGMIGNLMFFEYAFEIFFGVVEFHYREIGVPSSRNLVGNKLQLIFPDGLDLHFRSFAGCMLPVLQMCLLRRVRL